jgi:hypothetical protein
MSPTHLQHQTNAKAGKYNHATVDPLTGIESGLRFLCGFAPFDQLDAKLDYRSMF